MSEWSFLVELGQAVENDSLTRSFLIGIAVLVGVLLAADFVFFVRQGWFGPTGAVKRVLSSVKRVLSSVKRNGGGAKTHLGDDLRVPASWGDVFERDQELGYVLNNQRLVAKARPSVLSSARPISPVQFAPAFLTALGVIGTFLGITKGLAGLDLDGNAEMMMDSIAVLVGGMQTAFITSLAGLTGAALLMVVLAVTNALRARMFDNLRRDWARFTVDKEELEAEDVTHFLRRMADPELLEAQQRASGQMGAAASQLSAAATGLQKSLSGFSAEAIGEHVKEGFRVTMRQEVLPTFEAMRSSLAEIQRDMAEQDRRIMEALLDELRTKVIEPLAGDVRDSAAATRQASEAVMQLHSELGGISTRLAGAAEQLSVFQTQTLDGMNRFADKLEGTLNEFQEETAEILRGVASSMKSAVDHSVVAMEGQRTAFAESAALAAGTFSGIRQELEASLASQGAAQREMLDETKKGVLSVLTEAQGTFDKQTKTLQETGAQASALMTSSREALESTLQGIDGALQATRETVQGELERFRVQYQDSLNQFFDEQNTLLEGTLGAQRDGLRKVVIELQEVFEDEATRQASLQAKRDEEFQRLSGSMKEVQELSEAISATSSTGMLHVREAAQAIGTQVQGLHRQYGEMDGTFRDGMSQLETALTDYLQRAGVAYNSNFDKMDEAATRIHNRLLDTAEYLAQAEHQRRSSGGQA